MGQIRGETSKNTECGVLRISAHTVVEGNQIILPGYTSGYSKPYFSLPSIKRFAEGRNEEKVGSLKVVSEPEGHSNKSTFL